MASSSAPASYTPTVSSPGSAPQFGQQDATGSSAVSNLQTSLNTQNAGKAGYVPLAVDGKYGPLTQAATTFQPAKSNLIVTAGPAVRQGAQDGADLANMLGKFGLSAPTQTPGAPGAPTTPAAGATPTTTDPNATNPNDPYSSLLTQISNSSDAATKNLISGIQATEQQNENKVNQQYDSYTRGLQLLGIQHNQATFGPDVLAGNIQKAKNDQMDKLQTLQAAETKAISAANTAKNNGQLNILKEQMANIKQIQADKATALKEYYTGITQSPKLAAAQIDPTSAQAMLDSMNTLDATDKEAFIHAVASKFGLDPAAVVQSLSSVVTASGKANLATANAKATLYNKLNPKSKTTTSGSLSKAEIAQGEQYLNGTRGADNFVDPSAYLQAYKDWTSSAKGGTTKGFIAAFPPKDYVNPANTDLPKYLMPAKAKASGRSSN